MVRRKDAGGDKTLEELAQFGFRPYVGHGDESEMTNLVYIQFEPIEAGVKTLHLPVTIPVALSMIAHFRKCFSEDALKSQEGASTVQGHLSGGNAHYKATEPAYEPYRVIKAWGFLGSFNLGNALKYLGRYNFAEHSRLETLNKILWYIRAEIADNYGIRTEEEEV